MKPLTVLTGIDSFKTIRTSRVWRTATVLVLAVIWYAIGQSRPDGVYGAWGWRGLTAYFVGFAAEIPFMVLPPIAGLSYTGWIPNHVTNGVDYSWVVGLLVAGLVYLVLSRSLDLESEQAAIAASERELQTIDGG
jgi:purine-cytosine permease-like protein